MTQVLLVSKSKKTMEQIGIDTTIVQDGKEALEQLQQWQSEGIDVKQHIALIISDIEMPEMDGYSLTSAVQRSRFGNNQNSLTFIYE